MNTLEYQRIISALDDQLERAKREADAKQKREALEQHVKLVLHQITNIEARKAECEKYGIKPPMDLNGILTRLRGEKEALDRQLATPEEEPPVVSDGRLQDDDRAEVIALTDEISNPNPAAIPEVERWMLFEIWAIRWRIIMEKVGSAGAENGLLKRAYALIREAMNQHRSDQGWYIDALDKTKGGLGFNWAAKLEITERKLEELTMAKRKEREAEEGEAKVIEDLENAIATYAQGMNPETWRSLCHAVRQAARYEHLREDVAGMVEGWKPEFGQDFAFLWEKEKPEEPAKEEEKRITNREIVRRILHRLRSKGCIGASHAPAEKMYKGFPDHDQARAKDGLEMLVKAAIIRRKNTGIGSRVSVEAGMVARVDSFCQGSSMNIKLVDDWCGKEVA